MLLQPVCCCSWIVDPSHPSSLSDVRNGSGERRPLSKNWLWPMAPAGIPKCVWHHRPAPSLTMAVWAKNAPVTQAWVVPELATSWMLIPRIRTERHWAEAVGPEQKEKVVSGHWCHSGRCTHSHVSWGCEGRHQELAENTGW